MLSLPQKVQMGYPDILHHVSLKAGFEDRSTAGILKGLWMGAEMLFFLLGVGCDIGEETAVLYHEGKA